MSIGQRLLQVRTEKGLSQKKFADVLGVSKGAIGSYENDKQIPGSLFIMLVCDNFNIEPRWLLQGKGAMYYNSPPITTLKGLNEHNMLMDKLDPLIEGMRAEIERLKQELLVAQLERDRAKDEAYKAFKIALKAHEQDMDKE